MRTSTGWRFCESTSAHPAPNRRRGNVKDSGGSTESFVRWLLRVIKGGSEVWPIEHLNIDFAPGEVEIERSLGSESRNFQGATSYGEIVLTNRRVVFSYLPGQRMFLTRGFSCDLADIAEVSRTRSLPVIGASRLQLRLNSGRTHRLWVVSRGDARRDANAWTIGSLR